MVSLTCPLICSRFTGHRINLIHAGNLGRGPQVSPEDRVGAHRADERLEPPVLSFGKARQVSPIAALDVEIRPASVQSPSRFGKNSSLAFLTVKVRNFLDGARLPAANSA